MGSSQSVLNTIKQNTKFNQFASSPKISETDVVFWNELLLFSFNNVYKTLEESKQFEYSIIPLLESFIKNNLATQNLSKLLKNGIKLISHLKELSSTDPNYKLILLKSYNSILILRCCIKYLIQVLSENEMLKHFADENGNSIENLELLLSTLIEILVDIEVNETTYALHTESLNLIIILFSVQMYFARIESKLIVYQVILKQKCSIHAIKLMKALLTNFINQQPAPRYEDRSIIIGLASSIWNMVKFGYSNEVNDNSDRILSRLSLLLILILTNHCSSTQNLYKEALFCCIDSQHNYEGCDSMVCGFKIEFNKLFHVLCALQNEDQSTLLLYLLLHKNLSFRIYVLSKTSDLHNLVIPVLKILYTSSDRSSHHIYMALIVLLILSEDNLFKESVHCIMLKNVTWYKDKNISEISLGGLMILVFIRTIQFNIARTIDKFLHTNLLATLANMSSHFKNLSPIVCEKIIVLFKKLSKKMNKIYVNLQESSYMNCHSEQNCIVGSDKETDILSTSGELIQDISIYEEVLRMILEIINSTLASKLTHNPNLIYTLLYNRYLFQPFQNHVAFQDIVMNIETVLIYFANRIEAHGEVLSVEEVYKVIEHASLQWPADKLKKFPDLIFRYVEDDQPDEFFVPYIWTLVYRNSNLFFNSQNILLFNPHKNVI